MNNERIALKQLIEDFLHERLQNKLDKMPEDDETRQQTIDKFSSKNWIADAAHRVKGLQLISHAIKFQNPDAKGTSIYDASSQQIGHSFVATNTLPNKGRKYDVVGNAAYLDVYKFLQLSLNDETLLSRIMRDDKELRAALPGTEEQKTTWLTAFANITQAGTKPASHTLAKQMYFPIDDDNYHVIAPLFPTTLTHTVFKNMQKRFDEPTKEARKAKKEEKPYKHGYREYINLAIQEFGGTKPQNISQLNSERGGKAYLLPSLPPIWQSQDIKPPLDIESIFPKRFAYRVIHFTKELQQLLKKADKDNKNNKKVREAGKYLTSNICDELILFAAEIQNLEAGWSTDSTCKLSESQTYWLDPGREKFDVEWKKKRNSSDWQKEVCHDFAVWLNGMLETKKLHFGDDEYLHWKTQLEKELSMLKEVL